METNTKPKMLHSFGLLCNVLPFYGYLHESYFLMTNLSPKTQKIWKDYEVEFHKEVFKDLRKTLRLVYNFDDSKQIQQLCLLISVLKRHKILLKIFSLPPLKFTSKTQILEIHQLWSTTKVEFLKFTDIYFLNGALEETFRELFTDIPYLESATISSHLSLQRWNLEKKELPVRFPKNFTTELHIHLSDNLELNNERL